MTNSATDTVVIAGTGQAGFQTAASLRDADYPGRVVLVGDHHLPYQRPPLSKAFLEGLVSLSQLAFRPQDYFQRHDIEVIRGPVTGFDRRRRTAELDGHCEIDYDHLVLATGCRARRPGVPGEDLGGVHYLRDLDDAQRLTEHLSRVERLVVVGAGFIGLEVAAVALKRGVEATVLEFAPRAMGRAVSQFMGDFFIARHRAAGNRLDLNTGVREFVDDGTGHVAAVVTSTGEKLSADLVVVGVGVQPNTEVAERAGLTVDNGVVVDEFLRSVDDPDVSAVGDCSRFIEVTSGSLVRLESVQNAVDQARCVATRLAGTAVAYNALPWFWTDQLGMKLQIAGLTAGHDRTEVVGDVSGVRFSVYCFSGNHLLGVESVNRPADHLAARRLLTADGERLASITPGVVRAPGFSLRDHQAGERGADRATTGPATREPAGKAEQGG